MMRVVNLVAIFGCTLSGAQALAAGPAVPSPYASSDSTAPLGCAATSQCIYQINAAHTRTLRAIRKDALEQQEKDGGNLTPSHLAQAQQRLDTANRIYQYKLQFLNPVALKH